jgi:phosphoglycolate phosphatase
MTPALVVFDLDGTLVDTAPDLIGTLDFIFEREGLPGVPYAEARKFIGGGAKMMIERALRSEGRSYGDAALERLYAEFVDHYASRIVEQSRPFPGVAAALDELAARGYRFAVCTNKLEWLSRRLLGLLDLERYFVAICGQDTFGVQKPDPEILRRTIAQAGGHEDRAVMVGDSANDINTARAAGVPVVGVDFGYTDVPIGELGPDRVIGAYSDLPEAIRGLAQATPLSPAPT